MRRSLFGSVGLAVTRLIFLSAAGMHMRRQDRRPRAPARASTGATGEPERDREGSKHEPGWCDMTTAQLAATRLNLNEARCEALFASGLQPSDAPTADMVAEAINYTVQQVGVSGCVGQMAQEFGDHPDAAAERMRWVRQFAA
jgi:hypothetical protein